jgi:hypothetical protein
MAKTDEKLIIGFNRPLSEEKIKQLPNHLKTILLAKSSSGAVKADKVRNIVRNGAVEKAEQESENKFSFEMLKQIERLVGYQIDKKGNILIKNPIWKVLTQKDYESLVGKEIVCRMIRYENKDIGLARNKGLETPSYDDYFILIPSKVRKSVPKITIPVTNKKNLIEKVKTVVRDNLPGIEIVDRDKKRTNKDVVLTNIASRFTIVDLDDDTEVVSRENKKTVKVNNRRIEVATDMIVDALALDCQVNNIEQEHISNNIVSVGKLDGLLSEPEVINAIREKQRTISQELDEIEDDRCSVFGKYRPNGISCSDNK